MIYNNDYSGARRDSTDTSCVEIINEKRVTCNDT